MGRYVTQDISYSTITVLRFALAIPLAAILLQMMNPESWTQLWTWLTQGIQIGTPTTHIDMNIIGGFILIGFTTGAAALLLYYRGLQRTTAHIATICELTFPVVTFLIAISALNPYGDPEIISADRVGGMMLLLVSITAMSILYQQRENKS